MLNLVSRERTPLHLGEMREALRLAFHQVVVTTEISEAALKLAWAQLCFEAGVRGDLLWASFDNELGNEDATAEQKANGPVFETVLERELDSTGHVYRVTHIRPAFPDPEAGAEGYWARLRSAWPEAFDVMAGGDVAAFAHALRHPTDGGAYYTDTEEAYTKGLLVWVRQYEHRWPV